MLYKKMTFDNTASSLTKHYTKCMKRKQWAVSCKSKWQKLDQTFSRYLEILISGSGLPAWYRNKTSNFPLGN